MIAVWTESVKQETVYQSEFRLKEAATNDSCWFFAKALPIRDAAGKLIKWFGATAGIHDQKEFWQKLEGLVADRTEALAQANQELARSNEDL